MFQSLCFLVVKLKSSLRKVNDSHDDLVNHYRISVSQMTMDIKVSFVVIKIRSFSSFMTCHRVCNKSNTNCHTRAGIAYTSGAPEL